MSELRATNETFAEVAELLFGGGGQELLAQISKMNPTQSDVAAADRKKRRITAGLSAVGATAGAAGLGLAGHNLRREYKIARGAQKAAYAMHAPGARRRALKMAAGKEKFATALIPLEVAGLTGEVGATHILHGDTQKKVRKDLGEIAEQVSTRPTKGNVTRAVVTNPKVQAKGLEYSRKGAGRLRQLPSKVLSTKDDAKVRGVTKAFGPSARAARKAIRANAVRASEQRVHAATNERLAAHERFKAARAVKRTAAGGSLALIGGAGYGGYKGGKKVGQKVTKRAEDVDVIWSGEFAKASPDKQQLFGWASVIEVDGQPVVDLQGDVITPDEMEKAAYSYVVKSRKGGDMHLRDNWEPIQKSEMIESFIVTDEKRQAMGLPDSVPTGWWVGFQVTDPQVWADVRAGKRTGFSIHGTGKRTPS